MKIVRGLLLGLVLGLGLIRAVSFLGYVVFKIPSPLETYYLEAKMVLLADRAEAGQTLYPPWRDYPHVANFFGPIYFGTVGLIGRALGAGIPGLYWMGRLLSCTTTLLTAVVVGLVAAHRYGKIAGLVGFILCTGTTPTVGFSVMVRPDMAAEFLGAAGFFLATGRTWPAQISGGFVLVLAILTKQTTAIFLVAAVLAWVSEGDWKRGFWLGLGTSTVLGVVVGGVTLLVEPRFAESLAGESKTPWDLSALIEILGRMRDSSPDTLYFTAVGIILWVTRATGRRDAPLAVLAAVLLVTSILTSAKRGSDVNYYLSLRVVAALAVAALWQAWSRAPNRVQGAGWALAALLGLPILFPSTLNLFFQAVHAQDESLKLRGPEGRAVLGFRREAHALAADPKVHLLTDAGDIDLYARDRAAFGDPWLFRMLTVTGRIDPTFIRQRIDSQYYDLVISTSEIEKPKYDDYEFGLPKTLADRVRARYVRIEYRGGFFLYARRAEAPSTPGPGTAAGEGPPPRRP